MPQVKTTSQIASKWAKVTPQRTSDYEEGVKNPKKSWEEQTAAAADAQRAGVEAALAEGRFEKGVKKAGDSKWKEGATKKGVQRWGPGVQIAQSSYEKGFAPFRDVIEKTTLPPRYAKGDPRNIERVKTMADAMHKAKVEG